jgi:lysophospholipase L1-like esterase
MRFTNKLIAAFLFVASLLFLMVPAFAGNPVSPPISDGSDAGGSGSGAVTVTAPPGYNDDSGDGYAVGDRAYDSNTGITWTATSVTAGQATWEPDRKKKYAIFGGRNNYPELKTTSTTRMAGNRILKKNGNVEMSNIVLWYCNDYVTVGVETGIGNSLEVRASFEYPAGTRMQAKKNGANSMVIPSGECMAFDPIAVTVPANTDAWINTWADGGSGGFFPYGTPVKSATVGDKFERGASVTDKTAQGSGDYATTGYFIAYTPQLVVGEPKTWQPSYVILGDSIAFGWNEIDETTDTAFEGDNAYGFAGYLERLLGDNGYGVLKLTRPAMSANQAQVANQMRNRLQLANVAGTHFINALGSNDINNSVSAANLQTYNSTINKLFKPSFVKIFETTILARTTSSDSWATAVNQTIADATKETVRQTYNTACLAKAMTYQDGCFDITGAAQDANGKWLVTGGAYTDDGIHPVNNGHSRMKSALSVYELR